ncbi:hypothetical protein [Cumulibacter manganitolerans]|uniref:hypothetical protein n=1 Tax=Cumulibacter manganitolerans TaxID=1884992 RepID=UPI001295BF44|nr:hypothetical protein [Cumulibacter manganitolerans]
MSDEIELINDGDGLAVIGSPTAVERFLESNDLESKDLGLSRLGPSIRTAANLVQTGQEVGATYGRWVKLTKESADAFDKYSKMKGSADHVRRLVVTDKGRIKGLLEYDVRAAFTNPALLSGAAGLMAQLAMEQTMSEITEYLARIDEKLNDVLRAQEDAVWADLIGVGFDIEDAMTIREHSGGVNDVTWSKVNATTSTIARTQAYALRQLDALATKLEGKTGIGDIAETVKEIEAKANSWLALLARSFQLRDAIAVLELDRVLDAAPEDLDNHREALAVNRSRRLEAISVTTAGLLNRISAAAELANSKVLLNPMSAPAAVRSSNHVADDVHDFRRQLGIESDGSSFDSKAWSDAAGEALDDALEVGAEGVEFAKRVGGETLDRAAEVSGFLSRSFAKGARSLFGGDDKSD